MKCCRTLKEVLIVACGVTVVDEISLNLIEDGRTLY